ncbi:MAG: hypothetical protein QW299_09690 [Candidatus Caldarchaeum sp.]
MRYLTLREILEIYQRVMQQSGGLMGIRDLGALESVVAQPRMTFGGAELLWRKRHPLASRSFKIIP